MDFLVNDLSLAGQFHDIQSFGTSIERLMKIRQEIQRLGSALYCHRKLINAQVTAETHMQQAVQRLPAPQRAALMQWLTRHGPYWEDAQLHNPDDWLEVDGNPVTETALGEAAICRLRGLPRELVSFAPSNWLLNSIIVTWVQEKSPKQVVSIPNHWELDSIQKVLAANPTQLDSWTGLATQMKRSCTRLTFADDAFESFEGHPFVPGAAERIRVLLDTLDRFKGCFDDHGQRTAEGHSLYNEHFTGDKAWFSDSSDTDKNDFKTEMTFPHPDKPGKTLFCKWHGKVKIRQIRIHFSWPVRSDTPLYVVYVGPKITKR